MATDDDYRRMLGVLPAPPPVQPTEEETGYLQMLERQTASRRQAPSVSLPVTSEGLVPPSPPQEPFQRSKFDARVEGIYRGEDTDETLVKGLLRYGAPVVAGVLGGGLTAPAAFGAGLARAAYPTVMDILSQLATTKGLQILGVEKPGVEPLFDAAAGTVVGRALSAGIRASAQNVLEHSKAGRLLRVNERIDAAQEEGAIAEELGGMTRARIAQDIGKVTERVALKKGVVQAQVAEATKRRALASAMVKEAPAINASEARRWLTSLPVPDERVIDELYSEVNRYGDVAMPETVLAQLGRARQTIADQEARIASVAPELVDRKLVQMGKPLPRGEAVTETLESLSRPRGVPLSRSVDTSLELQDFVRKATGEGRWGIRIGDDALSGELDALLRRKESGSSRLLNSAQGFSPQQMAERAHEAGFLESPDVGELVRKLDESIFSGRPVLSLFRDLPEFGVEGLDRAIEAPTFQAVKETLTRYGQAIRSARAAVVAGREGAQAQLSAYSKVYGALQQGLDDAIEGGELPDGLRTALQKANSAFKVKATVDDLSALIEAKIRYPREGAAGVLNVGQLMNELEKLSNADLVGKLREVGVYDGLQDTLAAARERIASPQEQVRALRQLEGELKAILPQVKARGDARIGQLRSIDEQVRQRVGDEVSSARVRVAVLEGQRPSPSGALGFLEASSLGGIIGYGVSREPLGVALGVTAAQAARYYANYLMQPHGQVILKRFLEATGETVPAPATRALIQIGRVTFPYVETIKAGEHRLRGLAPSEREGQ